MPKRKIALLVPCATCPWRTANHGKPHPFRWYSAANLRRLWNQIRKGGGAQSCHRTDPSHPEHLAQGCRPAAKTQECSGSVIVVLRELMRLAGADKDVTPEKLDAYLSARRRYGLTKTGVRYWLIERMTFGGVPFFGAPKLPPVDPDNSDIGLPAALADG